MWRKLDHGLLHDIKGIEVCVKAVNGTSLLEKNW